MSGWRGVGGGFGAGLMCLGKGFGGWEEGCPRLRRREEGVNSDFGDDPQPKIVTLTAEPKSLRPCSGRSRCRIFGFRV